MNKPIEEALRDVTVLADLPEDAIVWIARHVEDRRYEPGDIVFRHGDPADYMFFMLEGEFYARPDDGTQLPPFIASAGQVSGALPHSRIKEFARAGRVTAPSRIAALHRSYFDEMLDVIPELENRLIGLMADRIRENARADLHHEKLSALGKLAAGLAHELNNPAAAIARGAETVRERLQCLRAADAQLAAAAVPAAQRAQLLQLEEQAIGHARTCTALDALTRSDREQELSDWLSDLGVEDPWDLAAELTDAGLNQETLSAVAGAAGDALGPALARVSAALALDRVAGEIADAANRMAELVRSVKEYSFMDTAAVQEIDIHEGLENTLTILRHQLKHGIRVDRTYDRNIPKICANGSELNQVWTNLIDNAIYAMRKGTDGQKVLGVCTALRDDVVLVEISDTGEGIPPEVTSRVFEPFFTTKKQGEGTGLGLDIVGRIVRSHHGDIRFESKPGCTKFQVRLPLRQPAKPE
jgi:signal transduction histidine kinase